MKVRTKRGRVSIACFFLGLLIIQLVTPMVTWALTSGPAQPEAKQFQPAGTSDMVDLFTGDFKYNIPLLDVGGYPVNLNYQSGVGMDDEASWVGLGWNLNAGAMNRQIRGIADDSDGDTLRSENYMKPKVTSGGKLTLRGEIFGSNVSGSLSLGVFCDNYDGYGAEIGANVGYSLSLGAMGKFSPGVGGGLGLTSNTQDGVSVTPRVSFSMAMDDGEKHTVDAGLSLNLGYNTREGLKNISLGASYNASAKKNTGGGGSLGSLGFSYNTPAFYPTAKANFTSTNYTYTGDIGGAAVGIFTAAGIEGYKTTREVYNKKQTNRTFGYLYSEKANGSTDAMMDFMREKENPVIPELNNVAVPIATPDIFSYSSQLGGGQIRLSRMSNGVYSDNTTADFSNNNSASIEYGGGAYFHGGTSVFAQDITTRNGKWKDDNNFLNNGDFAKKESLEEEHAYFQEVGEKHVEDQTFVDRIFGVKPVSVQIDNKTAKGLLKPDDVNPAEPTVPYKKTGRQLRRTGIMYLTAGQAMHAGFEKQIRNYKANQDGSFSLNGDYKIPFDTMSRVDAFRRRNHISEISVVGDDGKRMVYGLPVYNKKQDEYSFASHRSKLDTTRNLVTFALKGDGSIDNQDMGNGNQSIDEYYHKESQPAYATSYMLTGILSPDYVDMTDNGITEDDRGTAFKFNYSKVKEDYHWRTPYDRNPKSAQFNRSLNADPDDDKASFVYGEKELWYLNSIESKTMIAYFITADREDGLGADWLGNIDQRTKQRYLKEIRLYAKNNLVTPIKTVVFEYDYSLCKGAPNAKSGSGKLTLKSVYFKYASSTKGKYHPYTFNYKDDRAYDFMSTDRWGTYKPKAANIRDGFGWMGNDEFPYSTRTVDSANVYAGIWHLSEIKLPTGATIKVDYESDDYAYVQDRRSMIMQGITGMFDKDGGPTASLLKARSFDIRLDDTKFETQDVQVFKDVCLNGDNFMYVKFFINVTDDISSTDDSKYDFIPCYAKVTAASVKNGVARVTFEEDVQEHLGMNPIASAAWQRMRLDYKRYVYPGYKNRISNDKPVSAIISAIANATHNLIELGESFTLKAMRERLASSVKLSKSFARIVKVDGKKLGGGVRVKRIKMYDAWNDMASGESQAIYGQEYGYTIISDNREISSGVAAYEPSVGGDENPVRQPLKYTQRAKWTLDNFFYMEEPFGEALYPAPQVGYREVKIRNLGADGLADASNKTGSQSYEFYTAKEFPVYVQQTALQKNIHKSASLASAIGGKAYYEMSMSQGYTVFLNDMHGKSKAERVFDQKGQQIAATEYFYNSEEAGGVQRLKNVVDVVDSTGIISKAQVIGRNIDIFTDMHESETRNTGRSINIGVDVIPFFSFGLPLPHFPWTQNDDYRLFRSAAVLKTVEYAGVVTSVKKTVNGSSSTASYLLYDKYSGEPVLTQSENEFEDPVYSLSIPAYWMYGHMGMAYKTLGTVFANFMTDNSGVPYPQFRDFLTAGDELIDIETGYHSWVIQTPTAGGNSLRLIESTGRLARNLVGNVKVYRSGNRNILSASATSITSLKNPIEGNKLMLLTNADLSRFQILGSTAILYDEAWGQPIDCGMKSCPPGYQSDVRGNCYLAPLHKDTLHLTIPPPQPDFGKTGAFFYQGGNTQKLDESKTAFWKGRLKEVGIWMETVGDYEWLGVEKCITVPESKSYYFGHAADRTMRIFVDDVSFFAFPDFGVGNYEIWNVREMYLTAGKHRIRVEALDDVGAKSVGFELYDVPRNVLVAGTDEQTIRQGTILSSNSLLNDEKVLRYKRNYGEMVLGANFSCTDGKLPNMCDETPNCDYRSKDECPAGYTRSADGLACIPKVTVVAGTEGLDIGRGVVKSIYGSNGGVIYDAADNIQARSFGSYWMSCFGGSSSARVSESTNASSSSGYCGRLSQSSVWLKGGAYPDNWIGINTCLTVPKSKVYYFGMGAESQMKVYLDGKLTKEVLMKSPSDSTPYKDWKVYPVYVSAGQHTLTIEAKSGAGDFNYAVGLEVYDNTLAQLTRGRSDDVQAIYSTYGLPNGAPADTYLKDLQGNIVKRRYSCPNGAVDVCSGKIGCAADTTDNALNPYLYGFMGTWLAHKQMAWLTSRSGQDLISKPANQGAGVRTNGYYQKFRAFWIYNSGWSIATNVEWVTSNTMTMYDKYSQELESKNALDQYSAARYGYKSTLPVAVGANTRHREIFYEGLEDYKFNRALGAAGSCEPDEFNIGKIIDRGTDTVALDTTEAHSGNYSLKLKKNMALKTYAFANEHMPGIYLENNSGGEYRRKSAGWLGLRGFCPYGGGLYIFSAWIKDAAPAGEPGLTLTVTTGAFSTAVTLKKKAVVEGWKLVEGTINVPITDQWSLLQPLTIVLNGSNINIDDIRIFPYDGQLKTFSYDDKTQRVMAELDENNYATFYEYDDEGSLIRVKKETERGIMTIKENRSAYRKSN